MGKTGEKLAKNHPGWGKLAKNWPKIIRNGRRLEEDRRPDSQGSDPSQRRELGFRAVF